MKQNITLDKSVFKTILTLISQYGYSVEAIEEMLPSLTASPDGTTPSSPEHGCAQSQTCEQVKKPINLDEFRTPKPERAAEPDPVDKKVTLTLSEIRLLLQLSSIKPFTEMDVEATMWIMEKLRPEERTVAQSSSRRVEGEEEELQRLLRSVKKDNFYANQR